MTPTNIPGLALLVDTTVGLYADAAKTTVATAGATVACVSDPARSIDGTQPTPSARPVLVANAFAGRPGLQFDGADDFLTFGQPAGLAAALSGDYTVYARVVVGTPAALYGTVFSRTQANGRNWLQIVAPSGNTPALTTVAAGQYPLTSPGGKAPGDLVTLCIRYAAATNSTVLYLDEAAVTGSPNSGVAEAVDIRLGAISDGSYFGAFTLVDLAVYGGDIGAGGKAGLDAYYRSRDGQPATWPDRWVVDSNSIGVGFYGTGLDGYARRLMGKLGVPSYAFHNTSVGGRTMATATANAPARVDPLLPACPAGGKTYLIFAEGVNEFFGGSPDTPQQAHDLAVAYAAARRSAAASAGASLRLLTYTVPHNAVAPNATTDAFDALLLADCAAAPAGTLSRLPAAGVAWFDALTDLAGDAYLQTPASLASDGTHPNDAGHEEYAVDLLATARRLTAIPAPTMVVASAAYTVTVTWTASAGATGYDVTHNGAVVVNNQAGTSATVTGVADGDSISVDGRDVTGDVSPVTSAVFHAPVAGLTATQAAQLTAVATRLSLIPAMGDTVKLTNTASTTNSDTITLSAP